MTRKNRNSTIVAALLVGAMSMPIGAQVIIDGGRARDNLRSAAGRAPGNMVSAGVGRALAHANSFWAPVQITETSRPSTARALFVADAIEILFGQLNDAIMLFQNLLLARAGRTPVIPSDFLPS